LTTGAVTLIQGFGSAANLNIHLHGLVLDGVYHTGKEGAPAFHPAPALTSEQLQAPLGKIIARILRLLTREGHVVEEEGVTYVADAHGILDPDNLLAPLQAASCTYRIAFGPRAGRKVLSLRYAASRAAPISQQLGANAHGFSLHARARCAAEQRQALEHLPLHHAPGHRQRAAECEPRRCGELVCSRDGMCLAINERQLWRRATDRYGSTAEDRGS